MSSAPLPLLLGHLEGRFQSSSQNIETLGTGTPLSDRAVAKGSSICKSRTEAVTKAALTEEAPEEKFRSIIGQERIEGFRCDFENILQPNHSRNYRQTDLFDIQNAEGNSQRPNYESLIVEPKGGSESFQHIEDEIANKPTSHLSLQIAGQDKNEMFRIDEDRNLVKAYFHDMLKYINKKDATLADDDDGDLTFFIKQMPDEEMRITFSQWIICKKNELKDNFRNDVSRKLERLRREFDRIIEMVDLLSDEDQLIRLAENLDVTSTNAKN